MRCAEEMINDQDSLVLSSQQPFQVASLGGGNSHSNIHGYPYEHGIYGQPEGNVVSKHFSFSLIVIY